MIDFFSNWTKEIGVAVIIVSIIEILLTNNSNKKYINIVLGLFLSFNIISPFIINKDALKFEDIRKSFYGEELGNYEYVNKKEKEEDNIDLAIRKVYIEQLEKNIREKLKEEKFNIKEIEVNIKKEEHINQTEYNNKNINYEIEKIILKIENKKDNNNYKKNEDNYKNIGQEKDRKNNVKKIENINIGEKNNIDNYDRKQNDVEEEKKINPEDLMKIEEILQREYGVNSKCLEINLVNY